MYKIAYKFSDDIIFYFDGWGNKYVASGGNLAWRIKNPGLIRSRSPAASCNGSIGSFDGLAIFPQPEEGLKALSDWLQSKICQNSTLKGIPKHYRPNNSKNFLKYVVEAVGASETKKVGSFTKSEFQKLQNAICKLCGYTYVGNENFTLLPKIIAKIENSTPEQDSYLIEGDIILSKKDALEWVSKHRLDAISVLEQNGNVHLRSRPHHHMQHIQLNEKSLWSSEGQFEVISRSIGEKKQGQCIWAFINGISNSKEEAFESADLISKAANGEMVLSMPNDQILGGIGNFIACLIKKCFTDTPVVDSAVKFFRYLLKQSDDTPELPPVIVFVHSQGAIITEHALEHLKPAERNKLRIFSFGGGSFISPGMCHSDSHNFVSPRDWVPRAGTYAFQDLALNYHYYKQKGKTLEQIIDLLVMRDLLLHSDTANPFKSNIWLQDRAKYYQEALKCISNVTIVEPGNWIEHSFKNDCYQKEVKVIVEKYRK